MKIIFHGATETVTGSRHEVQVAGKRLLLDCGSFQGRREEARAINSHFAFPPAEIDAVFLSHGHADHCGNLPSLVKQGYTGPIYATKMTAALAALIMLDSAKIQEEDAAYLNQKTSKKWQGKITPLYTQEDAEQTIKQFKVLPYDQPIDLGGYTVELREAGHILGSAAIRIEETSPASGTEKRSVVFSGDVGRPNSPVVRDPKPFTQASGIITESTYGGRHHVPIEVATKTLHDVILQTVTRGGWVIIPSFALGRTQEIVELLHVMYAKNHLPPNLPIFVDSPLASRITEVFRKAGNLLDEETQSLITPFDFPNLKYVQTVQESQALNGRPGPGVIIASSGMCEGGRILHHLKHHVGNANNTVLLVGYQAVNTLGSKIQRRWPQVPILGEMVPLNAQVVTIDGLSAHADGAEMLEYSRPLLPSRPKVFLVHGEPDALLAQQKEFTAAGFNPVIIPKRNESYTL